MSNFLANAQAKIAQQISSLEESEIFSKEKIRKVLMSTSMVAATFLGSVTAPDASAMDPSTYRAIGTAAGVIVGTRISKNKSYTEIAAVSTIGGLVGGAIGQAVGERNADNYRRDINSDRRNNVQPQRYGEWVEVRPVNNNVQPQRYGEWVEQPSTRQVTNRSEVRYAEETRRYSEPQREYGFRGSSQFEFDASAFNMPQVLTDAMRNAGVRELVQEGKEPLSRYPLGLKSIEEASSSLIRGGKMFALAERKWDEAQLGIGREGFDARTKAAEQIISTEKVIESKVADWVRVRNILASKGFDVSPFDEKVSKAFESIEPASKYTNSSNNRYRP